ncbi:MAG: hypothetical protein RIR45_2204, partial [Pseudomonadota bacterium]
MFIAHTISGGQRAFKVCWPDAYIAATDSYVISQKKRKLIEQGFGWAKFIGPIRQVMVRGLK